MNRYILNVAVDGRHYCRIELPEIMEAEAMVKAKILQSLFVEMEEIAGTVELTMTRWNDVGTEIDL